MMKATRGYFRGKPRKSGWATGDGALWSRGAGGGVNNTTAVLFNPGSAAPELRLFTSTASSGGLKATVRRQALVIVTNQLDQSGWWYVHACGYEGWIHVGHIEGKSHGRCLIYSFERKSIYTRRGVGTITFFLEAGSCLEAMQSC